MDSNGLGLRWTDRLTGSDWRKSDQRGLGLGLEWTRAGTGFQGTRMDLELCRLTLPWTRTCVDPGLALTC